MPGPTNPEFERPASWSAADWQEPSARFEDVLGRTFEGSRLVVAGRRDDHFGSIETESRASRPRSSRLLDRQPLSAATVKRALSLLVAHDDVAPYPSAGALYPCHPFVVTQGRDEVAEVRYLNGATGYFDLSHTVKSAAIKEALFEDWAWPVGALVVVVIEFARAMTQYGERGLRFALLEAGLVAERVMTGAMQAGLGSCLIGGFHDDELIRCVDLDPRFYGVAVTVAVGIPASTE